MATSAADVDTKCPVCHEDFTDARFLPCFHVACRKCILSWLSVEGQDQDCPLCRAPIMPTPTSTSQPGPETPASVVDKLHTDLVTMALVNSKRELSTHLFCGVCDDVKVAAMSYCLDCSLKLCSRCAKAHKKVPATRDHRLEDLNTLTPDRLAASRRSPCASHANRPAELYCPDHCSLICPQCSKASHRKCRVKPVANAATQEREALTEQAKSLRNQEKELAYQIRSLERKITDIQMHFVNQVVEVEAKFKRLRQFLDWRCQVILDQLRTEEDAIVKPALEQKDVLEKQKASLAVHAGSVERLVLPATPDGALLGMLGQLKARLDGLEKKSKVRDVTMDLPLINALMSVTWQPGMLTRLEQAISALGQTAQRETEGAQPCILCGSTTGAESKPGGVSMTGKPRGAELAKVLKVGDRVKRGPDWMWGNSDGPPPCHGTVKEHTVLYGMKDWVTVQWDHGGTGIYRMGTASSYDLDLV